MGMRGLMRSVVAALVVAAAQGADFDYDPNSQIGPAYWSRVAAECAGRRQSPIDLKTPISGYEKVEFMQTYVPNMDLFHAELSNTGHGAKLSLGKSNMTTASTGFPDLQHLIQYHYHTPSEHTINGKAWPAELHLVHQPWDRDIFGGRAPTVVLGFMFEESDNHNAVLDQILVHKSELKAAGDKLDITLAPVVPWCDSWLSYEGSFTTPPCSEIVQWFVCEQPLKATKAQIDDLSNVVDLHGMGTARPVQPTYGRKVSRIWPASDMKSIVKYLSKMKMKADGAADGDKGSQAGHGMQGQCGGSKGDQIININLGGDKSAMGH